jgi:hypothetical protein
MALQAFCSPKKKSAVISNSPPSLPFKAYNFFKTPDVAARSSCRRQEGQWKEKRLSPAKGN